MFRDSRRSESKLNRISDLVTYNAGCIHSSNIDFQAKVVFSRDDHIFSMWAWWWHSRSARTDCKEEKEIEKIRKCYWSLKISLSQLAISNLHDVEWSQTVSQFWWQLWRNDLQWLINRFKFSSVAISLQRYCTADDNEHGSCIQLEKNNPITVANCLSVCSRFSLANFSHIHVRCDWCKHGNFFWCNCTTLIFHCAAANFQILMRLCARMPKHDAIAWIFWHQPFDNLEKERKRGEWISSNAWQTLNENEKIQHSQNRRQVNIGTINVLYFESFTVHLMAQSIWKWVRKNT